MVAAAVKTDTAHREPFVAFVSDKETKAIVGAVANKKGWQSNRVVVTPFSKVVAVLANSPTPEVLIIDVSGEADPLVAINQLADVCDAGTRVIAIGGINDVRLFRNLVELGVTDYLVKPVAPQDLIHAIEVPNKTPEPEAEAKPKSECETEQVFFVGVRGGVGVSTLAANTAWMLAHERQKKTALIDIDLQFGTAALGFDLEPGRGLRDALEDPSRIDSLFIDRAFVRQSENLRILAAEEGLDKPFVPNPEAVEALLHALDGSFDCLVMDIPRSAVSALVQNMDHDATVVIVTDLSLAGMRDCLRFLQLFKNYAPSATVQILANKVGEVSQREMDRKDFEKGIEIKIDALIPWDLKPSVAAENIGKAMVEVAKKGKAVSALRTFVNSLASDADTAIKKKGFFSRLMGKKG